MRQLGAREQVRCEVSGQCGAQYVQITYLPVHYTSFVKKQQTKNNFCYIETETQSHEIILIRFALPSK